MDTISDLSATDVASIIVELEVSLLVVSLELKTVASSAIVVIFCMFGAVGVTSVLVSCVEALPDGKANVAIVEEEDDPLFDVCAVVKTFDTTELADTCVFSLVIGSFVAVIIGIWVVVGSSDVKFAFSDVVNTLEVACCDVMDSTEVVICVASVVLCLPDVNCVASVVEDSIEVVRVGSVISGSSFVVNCVGSFVGSSFEASRCVGSVAVYSSVLVTCTVSVDAG